MKETKNCEGQSELVDEVHFDIPLLQKQQSCSQSDEELQMREILQLKKQIKKKTKNRKSNEKVFVGSGYSFDITQYFRFKKKKQNSPESSTLLEEVIGVGGYLSWLILLFALVISSFMPAWTHSINCTQLISVTWRFFIQSFLLIPFLIYEYRVADQSSKEKYKLSYILNPSNFRKIYQASFSTFFWYFCITTFSQWTQISHTLALGGLVNFFLSIQRMTRNSAHDLEPGGQVLIIVGIILVFEDSYTLSHKSDVQNEWNVQGYEFEDKTKRILADLGALVTSYLFAKISTSNTDIRQFFPPYLSLMLISILTTINLVFAAFFFNGASFDSSENWGIFNLLTNETENSPLYIGIIFCLGLILSFSIISKIYPNPLIPSLTMSFQPVSSSFVLQLTGIQYMPGAFACIGYIFMLLGNFLILIGQWMFQRAHKKQEIEEKLVLTQLIAEVLQKQKKAKSKKKKEMKLKNWQRTKSWDNENIEYESCFKEKRTRKVSGESREMKRIQYKGSLQQINEDS